MLGAVVVTRLVLTALILSCCADTAEIDPAPDTGADSAPPELDAGPPVTEQFRACEEGVTCETGYCAFTTFELEAGPTVCTTACDHQSDCRAIHVNSRCLCDYTADALCLSHVPPQADDTPGHCELPCLPGNDYEACAKYGLFCEDDCRAQGLTCTPVALFPTWFACRAPTV